MSENSLENLSTRISGIEEDVIGINKKLSEHDLRFGNGREAMGTIRKRVEALEPKAPDWQKILLAGLTVVGVLMGAQLWITEKFASRPTQDEIDQQIQPIQEAQKETAREIRDIEKHQSAQQTSIRNIERAQIDQDRKLDTILERLPKQRRSR